MANNKIKKVRDSFMQATGQSDDRRGLFQLPKKTETPLELQEPEDDTDMKADIDEDMPEKKDAEPEDTGDLKEGITRSIIRMLQKKGPPK